MNEEEHAEMMRNRAALEKTNRWLHKELAPDARKRAKQARDYLDRVKTPYEAQLTILQGDVHISPFTPKTYVPIEQLIQAGFGQEPYPEGFTADDAERLITPEWKRRDNEAEKKVLMLLADRRIEQEANRAAKAEAKAQDIGRLERKFEEGLKRIEKQTNEPGIHLIDYEKDQDIVEYEDKNNDKQKYNFKGPLRRRFFEALKKAPKHTRTDTQLKKEIRPNFSEGVTWKKLFHRTKDGERFWDDAIEHRARSHTYKLKI